MEQFFRSHPQMTQKYTEKALQGKAELAKCVVDATIKKAHASKDPQSTMRAAQQLAASLPHRNTCDDLAKSEEELEDGYRFFITSRFNEITIKGEKAEQPLLL